MSQDAAAPPPPGAPPPGDVRPLVGRPVSNRGAWLFGGGLVLAAVLLFSALEARRSTTPRGLATTATGDAGALIAPPPALAIPGGIPGAYDAATALPSAPVVPDSGQQVFVPPGPPRVTGTQFIPGPPVARTPPYYDPGSPDPPYRPGPSLPVTITPNPAPERPAASGDRLAGGRVGATRLLNPASTVPQGTVIQAVMETALDSNRPGFARAVVSRDIRSFDGSAVLIPRGSRLFGEYKADLANGQNRAFVNWQKLTRPDGVQIALESPAADPLGRAGVKGKVDTHFFQRFGGAVLQSVLDIGVAIASRNATNNNALIIAPGGTTSAFVPPSQNIRPTLRVRQGSRVSVFVARDLDFTATQ